MLGTTQRKSNLLIVDRSLYCGRLLRSELLHSGFARIRLASDTAEALTMLAGERFDAVLCDNETGPWKGPAFALTARGREDMIDPYVPIVMLSFIPTYRSIAACRDAGANTFLAKPVSKAQLLEKLLANLTERRRFVRVSTYFGPERRKGARPTYYGEERRTMRLVEEQIVLPKRAEIAA